MAYEMQRQSSSSIVQVIQPALQELVLDGLRSDADKALEGTANGLGVAILGSKTSVIVHGLIKATVKVQKKPGDAKLYKSFIRYNKRLAKVIEQASIPKGFE
jgi:hypothetical protein